VCHKLEKRTHHEVTPHCDHGDPPLGLEEHLDNLHAYCGMHFDELSSLLTFYHFFWPDVLVLFVPGEALFCLELPWVTGWESNNPR
jgi:hypothetical protein